MKFLERLKEHIDLELSAAAFYRKLAQICRYQNLDAYAELAADWAREELDHALELSFLLADLNYAEGSAKLSESLQQALDLEEEVAESLQDLLDLARVENVGMAEKTLLAFLEHSLAELQEKHFHLQRVEKLGDVQSEAFLSLERRSSSSDG